MHLNDLPPEVIQTILSWVPSKELGSTSLVCKAWRSAAFPMLFRCVRLVSINPHGSYEHGWDSRRLRDNYPEDFVNQVTCELSKGERASQFSSCVRRLFVGWEMNEAELRHFISLVSKMKNLEHLTWIVTPIKRLEWYDSLVMLCRELPSLCSVKVVIAWNKTYRDTEVEVDSDELEEVQYSSYIGRDTASFSGLDELSIRFYQDSAIGHDQTENIHYRRVPSTALSLISSALNIKSLCLHPDELYMSDFSYVYVLGVESTLSELYSRRVSLPQLRKLCIGSFYRPVFSPGYASPNSGLWRFIRYQQQLQELYLHMLQFDDDVTSWPISPRDIEQAVPLLRRFIGPVPVVAALLKSNLVGNLEVLGIIDSQRPFEGLLSYLLQELDESPLAGLSCLRGFKIFVNGLGSRGDIDCLVRILDKLAPRAQTMEELIIYTHRSPGPRHKEGLIGVISRLPHLRRLGLREGCLLMLDDLPGAESFSEAIRVLCPELVISSDPYNSEFSPSLSY